MDEVAVTILYSFCNFLHLKFTNIQLMTERVTGTFDNVVFLLSVYDSQPSAI